MIFSRKISNVYVKSYATVAGPREQEGPLKDKFDILVDDYFVGTKNFESGEVTMCEEATRLALKKGKIKKEDLDLFVAGDLDNQLACSCKGASILDNSFLGIYSACATSMEGVALATLLLSTKLAKNIVITSTSSFATSERQFRYPNEYGLQKKRVTTITATGSGSVVLSSDMGKIAISEVTFGKVQETNWNDVTDMGSPMALAAYHTIKDHLNSFNHDPNYYDLILTGDLSTVGSKILIDLFKEDNIEITNHNDCGKILFDVDKQKVFSGGSGASCCPLVTYSDIFQKLESGTLKRVLVVATGALHDPTYVYQKKSIPTIAHAVCFERSKI